MSKTKAIENVILNVLADGEWHQVREFKSVIMEKNPAILEKPNSLSVALYQMKEKKKMIEMEKKGVYRLAQNKNIVVNETNLLQSINAMKETNAQHFEMQNETTEETLEETTEDAKRQRMLQHWRTFIRQYENFKTPSYEMTNEEFSDGKWLYELNKEMEELILFHRRK
ncbi:MAG: hypothetical protein Q4C61_06700 [Lachnospiraceae bacterium]|nr:hypothetical protein [Lachnospiraceae bacterium]